MRPIRIGVDLGGTKTEVVALDDDGRVLLRRRVATPARDYPAIVATIAELVSCVERELGATGTVGIAMPGSPSPATGIVRNANTTVLNGTAFRDDVGRALGRAVRVANDADCFALSEATDGAGRDAHVVFGVILGTGVGGGIVIDRRVWRGHNGIAGEWGHNPLPSPDADDLPMRPCWCGRAGCIETYLSGPAVAAEHRDLAGTALDVPAIFASDEPAAVGVRRRYANRLGRALATVVNVLDPDIIVLGGGLSNARWLYDDVPAAMARRVFADVVDTPIVPNVHGDSSGVRGAARL